MEYGLTVEIAELYSQETGTQYDEEQIREFAADLERVQFGAKTPQEKNILLMQQTTEERARLFRFAAVGPISPRVLPRIQSRRISYMVLRENHVCLHMVVHAAHSPFVQCYLRHLRLSFGRGWRDTVEFYNFANKTWGDILLLYAVSLTVVALHELGHAYACKHYGARVRSMGFALST